MPFSTYPMLLRRSFALKLFIWTCVALVSWTASPLPAQMADLPVERGATEAVKDTVGALIQVLDDERLKSPDKGEERRHEIERIITRRVDYEEMAKRALGAPWSEINEKDRREFVGLFLQLLRDTFAGRITEHADEHVVYLGEQREEHFAEVHTHLKGLKVDTR